MNQADEVLAAAERRARALAAGEPDGLRRLLHPEFRWTSHGGRRFDREAYVQANTRGGLRWSRQQLEDPEVTVVDDVALLVCTASDTVIDADGEHVHRMPMTQVWVRAHRGWLCLAGHAGPLLD